MATKKARSLSPAGAVGYVRVSSVGQTEGVSLDDQANAIARWSKEQGLELLAVYREEGRSGRTTEGRVALREALEFCATNAVRVSAFVVYDLSRFARDAADQLRVQRLLREIGIRLTSVTLDLEDDAYGGLVSGLFGNINEFFSRASGDKIRRCMAETARRGGWPWAAPVGYRNGRDASGGKTVEPDPRTWDLLRTGFGWVASGVGPTEALRRLNALGLTSRHGRQLRVQELRKLLANAFYRGRVVSIEFGVDVEGRHPAMVDPETWRKVQERLKRRDVDDKPTPLQGSPTIYPLRGVARCEACGRVLTASTSRGKSGALYSYYHCWAPCTAVRVPVARLDEAFGAKLTGLEIDPTLWPLVEAHLVELAGADAAATREQEALLRRRRSDLQARRDRLVETYLDQELDQLTYRRHLQRLDADLQKIDFEHQRLAAEGLDLSALLAYAKPVATDLYALWHRLDRDGRRRLASLVFPAGVLVSKTGLRTPTTDFVFSTLQPVSGGFRIMVEQKGFEPGPIGEVDIRPRRQAKPLDFEEEAGASARVAPTRLPRTTDQLFGREIELEALDAILTDPKIHVVTLVAWGGVGKTALVAQWAARLAARDYDGASYFDWSFYSQGTKEEGSASGEPFLNEALRFFGGEAGEKIAASPRASRDKGAALAGFVAERRTLLILDGMEPLQYPPSSPLAGELKDPGVAALLKGLAGRNRGLCVVTTRESVADLAAFRTNTAPEWKLERLSATAGVALLEKLQVKGNRREKEELVEAVKGHALTLSVLGAYLRDAYESDIRKLDLVDLAEADWGGHAFRAIAAYERWFLGEGKEEGARQLAVLRLLGLFDRPADKACLAALRKEPVIPGLTEPLLGISDPQWNLAVSRLAARGLASAEGTALDAHPLVREYFARQLRNENSEAWRAAHGKLFEHLRDTTKPHQPDTLEGLQPLYQAVAHGCHAGRYEEARAGIYRDRILRGGEFYSLHKLGAFGTDLGAVACFFDPPWRRVSPALSEADQAWLLNQAASDLRALGRLTEALEPMRTGLEMRISQEVWRSAAIIASNLSQLELILGEVAAAMEDAATSVTFADRSGDAFQRMGNRTTYADALHQAGQRAEALALFTEAEKVQAERQPEYPRLYSLQGFWYCDLLLAELERTAGRKRGAEAAGAEFFKPIREVEERAASSIEIAIPNQWLLDIALNHLTLGCAALYRSVQERSDLAAARTEIERALDGLRSAGAIEFVVRALLTRAWLLYEEGNRDAARADLEEAQEIAERGPMPLFLADIALYRGRLFGDRDALAEARRLIEKHGYGRRLEELADAEAALG